jgi:site-specific recombinase XerC
VAAVERLNNSLPPFLNGKELDKFTPGEILEILEWFIPEAWRNKFNLDGYVLTEFTEERFTMEYEAMERNKPKTHIKSNNSTHIEKTVTNEKSHGVKHRSAKQKNNTTAKFFAKFYFTEHGQNPTHPTDKCYTLKSVRIMPKELQVQA